MSYLALARKWRPQSFEAITGQEHVTRTLQNAIEQDRVHHAFLFCGARGVGKTTAARVFAKALNCIDGPTIRPCGTCSACKEVASATSIDVLEIDGASNRGIGEIRELRDGVAYAPQRDRLKIYIIDEVHMLTTEAFNALLKTLEEPPAHVKFIFATTEPQKIPVTILSRCQRFDFKRIDQQTMVAQLGEILEAEKIQLDQASLALVARESEGSMRDALSLMDRIISFCGEKASYAEVSKILGVADRRWLSAVVTASLARDPQQVLLTVEEIFNYGIDLKQFTSDLVYYIRDILVLHIAGPDSSLIDMTDQEKKNLLAMGENHPKDVFHRLFRIAVTTVDRLSHSSFPRLELEMALTRMCELRPVRDINDIAQKILALERHLAEGTLPQVTARPFDTAAGSGAATPPRELIGSEKAASKVETVKEAEHPVVMEATPAAELPQTESVEQPMVAAVNEPTAVPPAPPVAELVPAVPPAPEAQEDAVHMEVPVAPIPVEPSLLPSTPEMDPSWVGLEPPAVADVRVEDSPAPQSVGPQLRVPLVETEIEGTEPVESAIEAPVSSSVAPPAPALVLSAPEDVQPALNDDQKEPISRLNDDAWERLVDEIRGEAAALSGSLDHGEVLSVQAAVVHLGFEEGSFNLRRAQEHERDILEMIQRFYVGVEQLELKAVEEVVNSPAKRKTMRRSEEVARKRKHIANHPAVSKVIDEFDGQVKQIRLLGQEENHGY
jgi:DNA polymerase-3 subunit gamma/tau